MASTLADQLAAASGRFGPRCSLSRWLPTLDDEARAAIVGCFHDSRVSDGVLAGYIASLDGGPTIGANQIGHHRRGRCVNCTTDGIDLARRP